MRSNINVSCTSFLLSGIVVAAFDIDIVDVVFGGVRIGDCAVFVLSGVNSVVIARTYMFRSPPDMLTSPTNMCVWSEIL